MKKNIIVKISILFLFIWIFIYILPSQLFVNASMERAIEKKFTGYSYDMDEVLLHEITRLPSPSTDAPSITLLVHGLDGQSSDWATEDYIHISYDNSSLVEMLRNEGSSNEKIVYRARFSGIASFTMIKLDEGFYKVRSIEQNDYIERIEDASKHMIIVCEFTDTNEYHKDIYKQLHYLIDKISYDVLYLTGKIPKVNLISHSRGGLISMMYASGYRDGGKIDNVAYAGGNYDNYIDIGDGVYEIPKTYNQNGQIKDDHPYNVAELYSIGTPYWGTNLLDSTLAKKLDIVKYVNMGEYGAKNVMDQTIQNEIYSCWEEAVNKNSDLVLHAISGSCDGNFILGIMIEDRVDFASILGNSSAIDIDNLSNTMKNFITGLSSSDLGDLFIDLDSQRAINFSNVCTYNKSFEYTNLKYIKGNGGLADVKYDDRSFEFKKTKNTLGIPHNLETRDSDIIEYICDNIEMGTPSSFYEYSSLTYNTIKFIGINRPSYHYDSNGNIKEEYSNIKIDLSYGIEGKAVTVIGDEAFKDETYLDTIIIPNTVIEIGDLAFENCSSLITINIPSSVTSIGDLAFKNCTSLTDVTINRDNYNITELGISAFDGCSSLNNIHVPSNRIFDYYNAINWKTYKSRITSDVSFEQININCYSNINSTIAINPGEKGILKINVNCSNNYIITSSSNNYIIFKLYDSDMNEIDISPTSYNSCSGEINSYLTEGEYYISVEYTHPAVEGEALINIQLSYNNNNSFEYGSNNVLTHLHNVNGELQNSSVYTNYYGRGLYKITINGNLQSYQNVLTIYDNSNKDEPMKRIETSLYELDARTSMVNNNLVVYFNEGYNYYIDIIVPIASYDTLTLSIERIEEPIEVDLVHYEHENDDDPTNDDIIYEHIIMTNETRVGDHFVLLEILEPSSISVIYDYTGTQDEFIYFVLFKEVYNKNESQYEMQLVFPEMMVTYGESLEWKSSITAGRHYIGYFNKLNPNSSISITITR